MTREKRKAYPTDVSDEEWSFVAAYLTLMDEGAPQRKYELREMFNALRWMARAGAAWRMLPTNFPPWELVYQQTQRWLAAGCFECMVSDLRSIVRVAQGRRGQPSAVILDGRTMQSTCASGPRAGYDGYKRKRGSKVHMAVDTLGQLLAVHMTPANEQERAQVAELARQVQQATGETVKVASADQGYTGKDPAQAARAQGIDLRVIKLDEAKKGFVLLPRRWVVERSFGSLNRFRRLARDYERLPETLAVSAFCRLRHAYACPCNPSTSKFLTPSKTPCPFSAVCGHSQSFVPVARDDCIIYARRGNGKDQMLTKQLRLVPSQVGAADERPVVAASL